MIEEEDCNLNDSILEKILESRLSGNSIDKDLDSWLESAKFTNGIDNPFALANEDDLENIRDSLISCNSSDAPRDSDWLYKTQSKFINKH
jgi:hypothetical protein